MKMKELSIFLVAIIVVAPILFVQSSSMGKKRTPHDVHLLKSVVGDKDNLNAAIRFRFVMLEGNEQNIDLRQMHSEAIGHTDQMMKNVRSLNQSYAAVSTALGPGNIGGRVRSIVAPPTNSSTMLIDGHSGRVSGCTDDGATWKPKVDSRDSMVASSQFVEPAKGKIVYVGTGEGWFDLDAVYGGGFCNSTNIGDSWAFLASTSNPDSQCSEQIETAKERIALSIPPTIPPNNCRVIATVESVDKRLSGANANDPCGKAPCIAIVRIDTVIGYGAAFPKLLSAGQKLIVKFAHTLGQTKQIMPEVEPPLSGLDVGSQFEALVNGSLAMGSSDPTFTVYGYVKK